jgi:hypothetical protein
VIDFRRHYETCFHATVAISHRPQRPTAADAHPSAERRGVQRLSHGRRGHARNRRQGVTKEAPAQQWIRNDHALGPSGAIL